MSDKHAKPADSNSGEGGEAAPKKTSAVMTILKGVAFVSVLVIVQVVGAAMLIPSAAETEKQAHQYAEATAGKDEEHGHAEEESDDHGHGHDDGEGTVEVELGHFNVTHYNPATNSTLSMDFELFASVLASDATEFQHLFEHNKVRVREQVIMTLHSAQAKDLSDAGLGLIKRKILEKTNRALGHPMVREVLFSKFNFIER
jgi:flagellar basal body-associated protein FliL